MADSSTGPRCDRCGVAAKWLYLTASDEWQFCGHHAARHHDALVARGYDPYELAVPDVRHMGTHPVHG